MQMQEGRARRIVIRTKKNPTLMQNATVLLSWVHRCCCLLLLLLLVVAVSPSLSLSSCLLFLPIVPGLPAPLWKVACNSSWWWWWCWWWWFLIVLGSSVWITATNTHRIRGVRGVMWRRQWESAGLNLNWRMKSNKKIGTQKWSRKLGFSWKWAPTVMHQLMLHQKLKSI